MRREVTLAKNYKLYFLSSCKDVHFGDWIRVWYQPNKRTLIISGANECTGNRRLTTMKSGVRILTMTKFLKKLKISPGNRYALVEQEPGIFTIDLGNPCGKMRQHMKRS